MFFAASRLEGTAEPHRLSCPVRLVIGLERWSLRGFVVGVSCASARNLTGV